MTAGISTSYYAFGGQRVAMRQGASVYWIHGDHPLRCAAGTVGLGNANLVTSITGTVVSEMRYYPYGETRWVTGTMPTNKLFTGQRSETASAVGSLINMNAREYSPLLGRFLSADSIVPRPGDPQSLNRYAYGLNNPLKYTDPTGHDVACPGLYLSSCGSSIPLPAWNEQGQKLSAEEQKRAIAAYLSLVNDPELWAKLFANLKAWDASSLPTDLSLFMWGTALHAWSVESLVYTRLGDAGPGLLEQRAANFEKEYGYRTGAQEVMARMGPDILGTAGMVFASWPSGLDVDQLSAAAGAADRNGLTKAGRALQKHSSRPGSAYVQPSGTLNPINYNQASQEIVDDILTAPGTTFSVEHRGYYGNVLEVNAADGRSLRYSIYGEFMGFLEPHP